MTEKEKAEQRWKELQEEEWKSNRFPEIVIAFIIICMIWG